MDPSPLKAGSGLPHRESVDPTGYRAVLAFAGAPSGAAGRVRLSAAVRRLNAMVAACSATDDDLDELASVVETVTGRLEPYAESSRYPLGERIAGPSGMFVSHPVIGALNPGAPPLTVQPDGERLIGLATYGPPFEGPRGFVHGGHIAAGFDSMVVMTAGINGLAGLTRGLSIRYRRPAPLGVPLVYEGNVDSTADRSTIVRVLLRHGDNVCAECSGDVATRPRSPR
jgi:acyl-coenzyme A thioesterase PaaI-like protein